jgi:hypothetical protein
MPRVAVKFQQAQMNVDQPVFHCLAVLARELDFNP